jgi:hypothetical protein
MTSVDFDLNVTIALDDAGKKKERYESVAFRFTTKSARALERAAGSGISWLIVRGQSVEALVLLLCYGLQWSHPKMTEQKAIDIIDAFIERGGKVKDLSTALHKALNESGVYGEPDKEETAPDGEIPLAETTATSETKADASVTG